MPIIQIDWQEIKEKFGDVTAIYALTHRQASLLLSLSEQLSWEKTFREFGYDFDDKDDLDWEIEDLRNNLVSPVDLADIITYIDEIEPLLRALQQQATCCDNDPFGGEQFTDKVVDGVGDVPENIVDAGYASSASDWTGFDDYKCMIAVIEIDNIIAQLRKIAPYVDNAGLIAGGIATAAAILASILTGTGSLLVLGILTGTAEVATFYKNITSGSFLDALADNVDENREALSCAIYQSDGIEDAISHYNAQVDSLFDPVSALILKNMNMKAQLRSLYAGRYDQQNVAQILADAGYDTDDFDCSSCGVSFPYQVLDNYCLDTTLGSWTVQSPINWYSPGNECGGYFYVNQNAQYAYTDVFSIASGMTYCKLQARVIGRVTLGPTYRIRIHEDTINGNVYEKTFGAGSVGSDGWYTIDVDLDVTELEANQDYVLSIGFFVANPSKQGGVDWVKLTAYND